jgi:hypothetical protein
MAGQNHSWQDPTGPLLGLRGALSAFFLFGLGKPHSLGHTMSRY